MSLNTCNVYYVSLKIKVYIILYSMDNSCTDLNKTGLRKNYLALLISNIIVLFTNI